jgi:hypothetical protein
MEEHTAIIFREGVSTAEKWKGNRGRVKGFDQGGQSEARVGGEGDRSLFEPVGMRNRKLLLSGLLETTVIVCDQECGVLVELILCM